MSFSKTLGNKIYICIEIFDNIMIIWKKSKYVNLLHKFLIKTEIKWIINFINFFRVFQKFKPEKYLKINLSIIIKNEMVNILNQTINN